MPIKHSANTLRLFDQSRYATSITNAGRDSSVFEAKFPIVRIHRGASKLRAPAAKKCRGIILFTSSLRRSASRFCVLHVQPIRRSDFKHIIIHRSSFFCKVILSRAESRCRRPTDCFSNRLSNCLSNRLESNRRPVVPFLLFRANFRRKKT